MLTRNIFRYRGLVAAICVVLVAGCQTGPAAKPTGGLAGKVAYKGAPTTEAKIQIQSSESGYADAATVDAAGKYKFATPVPVGKYSVIIEPIVKMPVAGSTPTPTGPPERTDIPKKYRSGGNSGLQVTVEKGKVTTFDVEMTD